MNRQGTFETTTAQRKGLKVLLAFLLATVLLPIVPTGTAQQAYADPVTMISGSTTIDEGGMYFLDYNLSNATISINTSDPVRLFGNGVGDASTVIANANIAITGWSSGIDLTIQGVSINNNVSNANVIDFTGGANTLTINGMNLIEGFGNGGSTKAMIHVGPTASLAVGGGGTLYFYAQGQGAGFGSNSGEKAGDLSFSGVTIFGKTTHPGPAIGSGSSYSGPQGNIVFNSGEYTLIGNSMAAAIGGGAGSGGGALATPGGNVQINGGTFNINVDYAGAAIGGGGYSGGNDADGGNLVVRGGSIRTYLDTNAVNIWSGQGATGPGVTPIVITAEKVDDLGSPVYLLPFDTTLLSGVAPFEVYIDDELFYSGGSHHYRFVNEDIDRDLETRPITTTLSNWTELVNEPNLYFYVTGVDHAISVNGEDFIATWDEATSTFTVAPPAAPDTRPWNQTIDISWYNTTDTEFTLTTAEQFAGFAAIVNGEAGSEIALDTFEGKTVKLGADIHLNDHTVTGPDDAARPWIPIAYTGQLTGGIHGGAGVGDFAGTLDGQGHVIYDLYFNDTAAATVGLFGVIIPGSVIRNLGVTGYVNGYRQNGGIVGYTGGNRTTPGEGKAWPLIENVFSAVTVIGDGSATRGTGGIVGTAGNGNEGGATIRNSYNLGAVTNTYRPAGGIAGIAGSNVVIENCYNAGTVHSVGGASYEGAITATGTGATIVNTYYLSSSSTSGVPYGTPTPAPVALSAEELGSAATVTSLGSAFNLDYLGEDAINGGLPVLAWQGGTPYVPVPTFGAPGSGDFNGDTFTTLDEALLLVQFINNDAFDTLSAGQFAALDVNGDGYLTMADVLLIVQIILNNA
jgi:hypothetical protein